MHKKILIVDDDQGICNALAILLREEGYCVDETTDSHKAADFIKKNKYDVCLFDYKMKGLHGIELLKIVKNINPISSVFIISAMLDIEELCRKEMKAGLIAGIIGKPFDVDALLQRIADVV